MSKDQEELDHIIQDMLDDDTFEPTFPEANEQQNKQADSNDAKRASVDKSKVKKVRNKTSRDKTADSVKSNGKAKSGDKKSIGEMLILIARYTTLAAVVLFFISIFMTWFSLSGNGVNYGFIRGEETRGMMVEAVQPHEIENLELYALPLINFSGSGLYSFSQVAEEEYLYVTNPRDEQVESIAARIHKYYMMSMMLIYVFTIAAALILAIFRRTKGITIVRNLAVLNGIVIGLNYMALKIPYFSMFAIHAKEVIKQSQTYMTLSMTGEGIAMDQVFYPYILTEESGLFFAGFFLGLWLLLSIVLSEVKNREEEIAIENGELDK